MKIMITGGAGFIGFHLASRLLEDKHEVSLIDNFNAFYNPAIKRLNVRDLSSIGPVGVYETDILDLENLRKAFIETKPEAIVHLAAWAGVRPSLENPALYSKVNVTGTVHVLELAREFKTERIVFGSSSSVYGGNTKVPFSEDDPVDKPISPYAATKKAGELLCYTYAANYGMNITCLRFFTVYGPRQRPEMAIHKFAQLMWKGEKIPAFGNGESRRDYTYVDDIISGIVAALDVNPRYEILNLGESQTTSLKQLIAYLEEALGRKALIDPQPRQAGDMEVTYADIRRARQVLGYRPMTPIKEGIQKFAEWFIQSKA